jgi:hypothetical protein
MKIKILYNMLVDKLIEKAFCDGYEYAQREFSFESKAAWLLTPGAYQAKEAAKYAYDKDEYEDKKYKYALKGLFTPGTATVMKKKAEKMAREGKSKEQIKKYLEKSSGRRLGAGIGEVVANSLTGGATGSIANTAAQIVGVVDKIEGNRGKVHPKSFKKKKK